MTMREKLRELAGPGYNLAAIFRSGQDATDIDLFYQLAVPVLGMAREPLGVLRALEVRCGPLLRYYAETGETVRMAHLVFTDEPVDIYYQWDVVVRRAA